MCGAVLLLAAGQVCEAGETADGVLPGQCGACSLAAVIFMEYCFNSHLRKKSVLVVYHLFACFSLRRPVTGFGPNEQIFQTWEPPVALQLVCTLGFRFPTPAATLRYPPPSPLISERLAALGAPRGYNSLDILYSTVVSTWWVVTDGWLGHGGARRDEIHRGCLW